MSPNRIEPPHFRADIEGIRALAVSLVLLFHARVPGFSGGFVGVDVFFALSGYLITWRLVNEVQRTGGIDLAGFYARRIRRLLPALAVVLLASGIAAVVLLAPAEQLRLARGWLSSALYLSNIDFALQSPDYHGADAAAHPLLHTWSLSVEEQFYVVWPWLLLVGLGAASRHRSPSRRRLILALGAVASASFVLSLGLSTTIGGWAFFSSPTRAWQFAAGALAVLIPVATGTRRHAWGGWLGLGLLAVATAWLSRRTVYPGVAALIPIAGTVLILRAGAARPASWLSELLSLRPVQAVGAWSYSWYLWHWPVLVFAESLGADSLLDRLVAVSLSLVPAITSYYWIEQPIRASRWWVERPRRAIGLAMACAVGAFVGVGAWTSASVAWAAQPEQAEMTRLLQRAHLLDRDECGAFDAPGLVECAYGDTTASRTVVLIGDSHAAQWVPAVDAAADSLGWRLTTMLRMACPMVDTVDGYNNRLGRVYTDCSDWRQRALDRIAEAPPDVVIVAPASGYKIPGDEWRSGTEVVLRRITGVAGRTVFVVDPGYVGLDLPRCLARSAWRAGDALDPDCSPRDVPGAKAQAEAQRQVAAAISGIEILDVRDRICNTAACDPATQRPIQFWDHGHLAPAFARTFANDFAALLAAPASARDG